MPQTIVDENGNAADKQVTYTNLLTFTDSLLQKYKIGAYVWLDPLTLDFLYVCLLYTSRCVYETALKLDGFEEMLKDIEAAGGTINKAVDSTMKQSAQIVQAELKKQMQGASPKAVDSGLINRCLLYTS